MAATKKQLALLHIAYKRAGLNEQQYRNVLRNAAGVESGRQLSNLDFENVMAVIEDSGFRDERFAADYWRAKVAARGYLCGERMAHKIGELAPRQRYPLAALFGKFSDGRTEELAKLRPREAWNLIEMLKAVVEREEKAAAESKSEAV
jgi:hypothetical protein